MHQVGLFTPLFLFSVLMCFGDRTGRNLKHMHVVTISALGHQLTSLHIPPSFKLYLYTGSFEHSTLQSTKPHTPFLFNGHILAFVHILLVHGHLDIFS